jgi:hypothetical protein
MRDKDCLSLIWYFARQTAEFGSYSSSICLIVVDKSVSYPVTTYFPCGKSFTLSYVIQNGGSIMIKP